MSDFERAGIIGPRKGEEEEEEYEEEYDYDNDLVDEAEEGVEMPDNIKYE